MKFFSVIVLLVAGLVAAGQDTSESTTTVTSTTTKTMTLTQCNPTYTDCPYRSLTATATTEAAAEETTMPSYPAHNTTMVINSTGGFKNHTAAPTIVTATQTSIAAGSTSTGAAVVSQSGAGSNLVNSGLLMGVLAAGAALL